MVIVERLGFGKIRDSYYIMGDLETVINTVTVTGVWKNNLIGDTVIDLKLCHDIVH